MFRHSPFFYYLYDAVWLVLCGALIAALSSAGWTGFGVTWGFHLLGFLAVAVYLQILSSALIHNASHRNFPLWINRIAGEITGVIVMTRFASWEILHRRHHAFSDDVEKDPHYAIPGFWRFFAKIMMVNLEKNIRQQFLELWGDTPTNRRLDTLRTLISAVTMIVLAYTWYCVLGPALFFGVFAPSAVAGAIHIGHFNWITHRGDQPDQDYKPVNLDHGIYWFLNRVCFGLYFHANHHKNAGLFNPMHLDKVLAKKAAKRHAA